jgi:hypothetical protein
MKPADPQGEMEGKSALHCGWRKSRPLIPNVRMLISNVHPSLLLDHLIKATTVATLSHILTRPDQERLHDPRSHYSQNQFIDKAPTSSVTQ